MPIYTDEISIYNADAIEQAIGDSRDYYITEITGDGIWVTPHDARPSNGQATSTTRGWHIADALEYFRGTVRYIKAWLNVSTPTVRLGQDATGHADVTPDGLEVFAGTNGADSVAKFSSTSTIGQSDKANITITPTALSVNGGNASFLSLGPQTWLDSGEPTGGGIIRFSNKNDCYISGSSGGSIYISPSDNQAVMLYAQAPSSSAQVGSYFQSRVTLNPPLTTTNNPSTITIRTTIKTASGSTEKLVAQVLCDGTIVTKGNFVSQAMAGVIQMFAGSTPPTGWLVCDGSAVSRTTYEVLFAAIGTTWGAGDGSTTFNLPDLRGRAPIGAGTGSGLTARTLAGTGGSEKLQSHNHSLTGGITSSGTCNITSSGGHTHTITTKTANVRASGNLGMAWSGGSGTSTSFDSIAANTGTHTHTVPNHTHTHNLAVSNKGDGNAENMQPFAVVNFIICTGTTS